MLASTANRDRQGTSPQLESSIRKVWDGRVWEIGKHTSHIVRYLPFAGASNHPASAAEEGPPSPELSHAEQLRN